MTLNSIRVRLLLAAAATILAVLLATALIISMIFQRHLEKRIQNELDKHFIQLAANLEVQADGAFELSQELADPRFQLPLSGLYWQVDLDGKPVARSRSLWDEKLTVPTPPKVSEEEAHVHELPGPAGQQLYSLERAILLNHLGQEKLFVVTVGLSRREISGTVLDFARDVAPALGLLGAILLLATWLQLTLGLRPLSVIKKAVEGIRAGANARIDDAVAEEVKPLVTELNQLLAANEQRNREARQRAADLAHGLRTPLTVLGSVSRSLKSGGHLEEAEKVRLQTEHMRKQVEWELAKTLSSTETEASWLGLAGHVQRLVRVVRMAEHDSKHAWHVDVSDRVQCRLKENDLNEIVGNVLENAQKCARGSVHIHFQRDTLVVEDDGPGVMESEIVKLTERGYSGAAKVSSGLGLAIVKQLVDKNGLTLTFDRSSLGGLRVSVKLPSDRLQNQDTLGNV